MSRFYKSLTSYISKAPGLSLIINSVGFLLIGGLLCWFLVTKYPSFFLAESINTRGLRLNQDEYPLVNPLLLCNVDSKNFNKDQPLSDIITNFINDHVSKGLLDRMSVYLINYKTGKWVGVNENEKYDPASMLKVPVMIAYYKNAENNQSILSEKTSFIGDDQNVGEYFSSKNNIKSGKSYTIDELIKSMIISSDNTAGVLLQNYIDRNSLLDVYTDLGLPIPNNGSNVEYISAKLYAYFLRILYNGTYLDHKYSEKALEILTKSQVSGIRNGVPKGTLVAEKFGERSVYDINRTLIDRELHDCGIVYKPNSSYLLCIMSRGKDFDVLMKNISDLSTLVYENIDN